MKITSIGTDLAKNVFQVHGVDERGKIMLKKQVKRDQMVAFFANLPPCLIGMEACGGAHHWARKLQDLGHTVRLIAPQFVKPYVKTNKNDVADAEAICEALARPNMRSCRSRASNSRQFCHCTGYVRASSRHANVSSAAGPVIRGHSVNSRSRPHSGHPGARQIVTPMTVHGRPRFAKLSVRDGS